jgi:single-strand DNA-binding protein
MNRVTLIGNSGADAELKMSQNNSPYCFFSIATSEKKQDGTFESTWHRVKMFGKTAEIQAPLIKKGSKVFVEGKMTYTKFTNKNGIEQTSADIMAFQVGVMTREAPQNDAYAQGQTQQQQPRAQARPPQQQQAPAGPVYEPQQSQFSESDIPF